MKTSFTSSSSWFASTVIVGLFVCCTVATQVSAQTNCATPPTGLVSWWRGENSTVDAADGNTGTWAGFGNTNSYGAGVVGQAFVFDGTHRDRVDFGNPTNLQLQDFTIEAWIKRSSTTVAAFDVLGADGSVAGEGGVVLGYGRNGYVLAVLNDGRLVLGKTDVAAVISVSTVSNTNLHHVAVTKAGSNVVFYIDGAAESAAPFITTFTFDTSISIGSRGDARGGTFYGRVDEPAIFNRALATNEIQAIYNAGSAGKCVPTPPNNCAPVPDGLVSWWRAEGSAFDEVGTNIGSLVGNTTYASAVAGQGFKFDGSGDYVQVPASASLNLSNAVTLECWYKDEGTADWYGLMVKSSASGVCNYGLHVQPGGGVQLYFFDRYAGYGTSTYAPVPAAGVFHHVAATFRQADVSHVELKTFIDGQCVKVALASGNLSNAINSDPVTIGGEKGGSGVSSFFKGVIDEPAIYNRALSTNDIQAIYNAGSAGKCLAGVSPVITSQPADQTVLVGRTAGFSVSVSETAPLSYQWNFNGTNIAGATSSSLTFTSAQFTNAGIYSVMVSNMAGSVTSSNAVLTVNPPVCAGPASGLVSWWQAESNALDQPGINNGNLIGGVVFAPGMVGQGFSFNGTSSYVQIPANASLNLSNEITLECWYKDQGSTGWYALMAKRSTPGAANFGLHINSSGGQGVEVFFFDANLGAYGVSDYVPVPATGVFHHIAATFKQVDSSHVELKTFIDGQCVKVAVVSGKLVNSLNADPMTIGAELGSSISDFFKGIIDEPAIYNRALSTNEIQAIYDADSLGKCAVAVAPFFMTQPASQTVTVGATASFNVTAGGTAPLSYQWSFNGTNLAGATSASLLLTNVQSTNAGDYSVVVSNSVDTATSSNAVLTVNLPPPCTPPPTNLVSWWRGEGNALDQAGRNNGTLANGATFAPGKVGTGFLFNGVNAKVDLGDPDSLKLTNSLTIEAWIFPTTLSSPHGHIIFRGDTRNLLDPYYFSLEPNATLRFHVESLTAAADVFSPPITTGQWYHVAGVLNDASGQMNLYVNGSSVGQITTAVRPFRDLNPAYSPGIAIGNHGPGLVQPFGGIIDELAVFNQALTTNEIQAIYNAGLSGKCVISFAPFITTQPTNRTVTVGGTANFYVTAGGTVPLSYQWTFNGTNVDNATNSSLTLTNVQFNQAGNYAVVVANDADSVTSSNALLTVNFPPATVRVISTNVAAAGTVVVPVTLAANGNENALGFSLNFATSRLAYVSASLGSGIGPAPLFVNDSQAGSGKLGLALSLSAGSTFPAGTQEVITVTFTAAVVTSNTVTPISFGDSPIGRQLSDALGTALQANYATGTVSIAAVEYEGDVSPRPSGDRAVTITDWVLAGRYAARLDYPTNAVEFQRADCAPRETLGNGAITVSDWVQAGRYAAGLNPLTPVGGPTSEGSGPGMALKDLGPNGPGTARRLQIVNTVLAQNQTATVRVNLESQGDENALGFSLTFDPAVFSYVGASLGSAATGATLNVNTNQAGSGGLGFVLALPTGTSFAAGTREVVKVSLRASAAPAKGYSVSFGNQQVTSEVSDAAARVLPADYVNATVTVNPPPSLNIMRAGQHIALSWPLWASNFVPQEADAVMTPLTWTNVVGTVGVSNNENVVTLPVSSESKFYRLSSP